MELPQRDYLADIEELIHTREYSAISDYFVQLVDEGVPTKDVLYIITKLVIESDRLALIGRSRYDPFRLNNALYDSVMKIARYILDKGEALIDYFRLVAGMSIYEEWHIDIAIKYLGYDVVTQYAIDEDGKLYPSTLEIAYSESYERLLRVVGFLRKYGFTCLELLLQLPGMNTYASIIRRRESESIRPEIPNTILTIANILVDICGQPFEELIQLSKDKGHDDLLYYLEWLSYSGV